MKTKHDLNQAVFNTTVRNPSEMRSAEYEMVHISECAQEFVQNTITHLQIPDTLAQKKAQEDLSRADSTFSNT